MNLIEQMVTAKNSSQAKRKKVVKESYNNEINEIWDFLVGNSIATGDELNLVTDINGYSVDTLNDVLYARTGYRSIDQLDDELDESKSYKKKVNEELDIASEDFLGYEVTYRNPYSGSRSPESKRFGTIEDVKDFVNKLANEGKEYKVIKRVAITFN